VDINAPAMPCGPSLGGVWFKSIGNDGNDRWTISGGGAGAYGQYVRASGAKLLLAGGVLRFDSAPDMTADPFYIRLLATRDARGDGGKGSTIRVCSASGLCRRPGIVDGTLHRRHTRGKGAQSLERRVVR
jgi:hypothetical protein